MTFVVWFFNDFMARFKINVLQKLRYQNRNSTEERNQKSERKEYNSIWREKDCAIFFLFCYFL